VIESSLVSAWGGLLGSATLAAIVILALCVMVGAVKQENLLRHLGMIVGVVILLIMLPAIIISLWNSMTLGQHLGIATILIAIIFLICSTRRKSRKAMH
jgi:Ca2+/Na+ antiporter